MALDDIIQQLRQQIDEIEHDIHVLGGRRDRIAAALAALNGEPVQPTFVLQLPAEGSRELPATPKAKTPPQPKAASVTEKKTRKTAYVPCPKCGVQCTPQNMWRHDRAAHSTAAPTPTPVARPAVPINGKVLACTECDFTCSIDRMAALSAHTFDVHKRRPTLEEKQPVAA